MPVPPAANRNYIALVSDATEEQRALELVERSNPRVKDYLLGRMASLLRRRRAA